MQIIIEIEGDVIREYSIALNEPDDPTLKHRIEQIERDNKIIHRQAYIHLFIDFVLCVAVGFALYATWAVV